VKLTRRRALQALACGAGTVSRTLSGEDALKYQPTWESLKQYRCPEWFRDAKFGVWAHWGPQGAPMQGDWYARNMYIQGTRQYKYHLEHFGHPSQFGYKDIIPLWTGKNWEPETLIRRYKKMGARYFAALGVHCDNFDCWNSRHHRWNAVNFGPKRDVVGTWAKIARQHGMRFAVSEHLAWSYSWFNVNKNSDATGPYTGVPYDGNDPRNQDLYFEPHPDKSANYAQAPSDYFKWSWFARVKDLVDQYRPDLVYTDGGVFGQIGLNLMAHYYNANSSWHNGELEGVYTIKNHKPATRFGDYEEGAATRDIERGLLGDIQPEPFQTDTCLGQWQYFEGFQYKKPLDVIHMLIDVVSKNGTMLLSVPQLPDGTIDTQEEGILDEITKWMSINGEAIFETRPWRKFGEGPTSVPGGLFSERRRKPFTSSDIRFTTKNGKLFAFVMGWPEKDLELASLGTAAGLWSDRISNIRLLGSQEKLRWNLEPEKLVITRPAHQPGNFAIVFEISA
jgi:alpha-L-fucosidase